MTITVHIVRNEKNKAQDKLADAELQFIGGELDGLKLLGFGIWQQRNGSGRNVTFPARPFMVNGERRNFALIRAVDDRSAEDRLRQPCWRRMQSTRRPSLRPLRSATNQRSRMPSVWAASGHLTITLNSAGGVSCNQQRKTRDPLNRMTALFGGCWMQSGSRLCRRRPTPATSASRRSARPATATS
jgi:hypothetical protein